MQHSNQGHTGLPPESGTEKEKMPGMNATRLRASFVKSPPVKKWAENAGAFCSWCEMVRGLWSKARCQAYSASHVACILFAAFELCSCASKSTKTTISDDVEKSIQNNGRIPSIHLSVVTNAALHGDSHSSLLLFYHYASLPDMPQATQWIRLSCVQGNSNAMVGLACILDKPGQPEAQVKEGKVWASLARQMGNKTANEVFDEELKPDEDVIRVKRGVVSNLFQ